MNPQAFTLTGLVYRAGHATTPRVVLATPASNPLMRWPSHRQDARDTNVATTDTGAGKNGPRNIASTAVPFARQCVGAALRSTAPEAQRSPGFPGDSGSARVRAAHI